MFIETEDSATAVTSITGIDCEGLITSAIVRLSGDSTPKLYEVSGHEETDLTKTQGSYITRQNIDVLSFDFSKEDIPEDADMLLFNMPLKDLTDAQLEQVLSFIDEGKDVVVIMSTDKIKIANRLENFDAVFAKMGLEIEYKTVLESDTDYWLEQNSPYFSQAQLNKNHSATKTVVEEDRTIGLSMPDSIVLTDDNDDNLKIEALATSSSSAYSKEQGSATMAQVAGDKSGTFNYAMAVTNVETDSRMLLLASRSFVESTGNTTLDENNLQMLVSSIRWLAGQSEDVMVSIKSLYPANLVTSQKQVAVYTVVVVVVFPALVLGYGLFVWNRRRKR
jgi:ABC-2 type transport system permease protein